MALEFPKPEPLRIGDSYHFTLTSYEPTQIEVHVPQVTDVDVDLAIESIAQENGITGTQIDDAWVQENAGVPTVADFRSLLHEQLERANAQYAEASKVSLAASQLAKRLMQRIPADEIAKHADQLRTSMQLEAMQSGMQIDSYLAQLGFTMDSFERLLQERAEQSATENAALAAFADERNLKATEDELPLLFQLPDDQAAELIEHVKKDGRMSDLLNDARIIKAGNVAASEASATYMHETAEEAAMRTEQVAMMLEAMRAHAAAADSDSGNSDEKPSTDGFKLIK